MGLSGVGVQRINTLLEGLVTQGPTAPPGLVGLVACGDQTHVVVAGRMSLDGPEPMRRDAIFRLASMTKPVTAIAALMLIEEGKLRLDEPVERLLPELADRRVLTTLSSPVDDTVPANRSITVEDVLTYRLGLGALLDPDLPIYELVADLPGFGRLTPDPAMTPDLYMQRLHDIPLMAQPGERWMYTAGSNVLGVLISRAGGQPLDMFLQDRIFRPLGMLDTGFCVPQDKIGRVATAYLLNDGKLELFGQPDDGYATRPNFPAGDIGLFSTVDDFASFARFLTTGRAPDGRELISQGSLKAMQTNYLTSAQIEGVAELAEPGRRWIEPGRGWGYGVGVFIGPNNDHLDPGAYGWNGGFGTSWFTDPAKDLTALLFTQRVSVLRDPPTDFWRAAYAAI